MKECEPHQTYNPSSIEDSAIFEEMLEHFLTLATEVTDTSDYAPASPLYPRYEAASDAYAAATFAMRAIIDAHCALEVFKAVHRLIKPHKQAIVAERKSKSK